MPPTAVTLGKVAGKLVAGAAVRPHVNAPPSPLATKCGIPWAADRFWMLAYWSRCPLGVSVSHAPRLSEMTEPRWSLTIWSKARSACAKSGAEK
ncbi:MAG: hypothetical protein E6J40_15560 [Chloroflexi bacterium]|nr:MAG: hypothetical protein E6J40_15560 [Chloroflexota bacterium]